MRHTTVLLTALTLMCSVASATADSIGIYAPRIVPEATPLTNVLSRYSSMPVGKTTTAQLQAYNDMMCERVDLLSTNYVYATNKHDLVLAGCPPPSDRRVLSNGSDLSREAYLHAVSNQCAWCFDAFTRDPQITTGDATHIYPEWQSRLCADIGLSADASGISTSSEGICPYDLWGMHFWSSVPDPESVTPVTTAISNVAAYLSSSYVSHTNAFNADIAEERYLKGYMRGYADRAHFGELIVSQYGWWDPDTGLYVTNDVISALPFYAFDRICTDMASGNVAYTKLNRKLSYKLNRKRTTINCAFDTDAIRAWLRSVGQYGGTTNVMPEVYEPYTTTSTLSQGYPSETYTVQHAVTPISGYISREVAWTVSDYNDTFYETASGVLANGNTWIREYRALYRASPELSGEATVTLSMEPDEDVYVTHDTVSVDTGGRSFYSANRAFTERPAYFKEARMTLLGKGTLDVLVPAEGLSYRTNELAVARLTSPTADVTAAITNGVCGLVRLTVSDTNGIPTSVVPLTITVSSVDDIGSSYDVFEYRTRVVTASGSTVKSATYAAKYDMEDHYPKLTSSYNFMAPSAGESISDGQVPSAFYTTVHQTFTGVFTAVTNGAQSRISRSVTLPTAVFENRYAFTSFSGNPSSDTNNLPHMAAIGPSDDYGDGDGGFAFDALVDPGYIGSADGKPGKTFTTIDAAIDAVKPGGTHAVSGHVPKIGLTPGTYSVPARMSVNPNSAENKQLPCDVRLIGLGKGVQLLRNSFLTGRYYSFTSNNSSYVSTGTSVENVTLNLGTRQSGHHVGMIFLVNCDITGDVRYSHELFKSMYIGNCRFVGLKVSSYDCENYWAANGWSTSAAGYMLNVVDIENSIIRFSQGSGGRIALMNPYCGIYDSYVDVDHLFSFMRYKPSTPILGEIVNSTIHVGQLDTLNSAAYIKTPVTDSLLFIDGLQSVPQVGSGNVILPQASHASRIDTRDFQPYIGDDALTGKGFHGYVQKYK